MLLANKLASVDLHKQFKCQSFRANRPGKKGGMLWGNLGKHKEFSGSSGISGKICLNHLSFYL